MAEFMTAKAPTMQNSSITGMRMFRGTLSTVVASLTVSHPSGSMTIFASKKTIKIA